MSSKPRLCFALPGNNCLQKTNFGIHVTNLVRQLAQYFEITIAFRSIDVALPLDCPQVAIWDRSEVAEQGMYYTPQTLSEVRRSLGRLRTFARQSSGSYDYLIEWPWRLNGALTSQFAACGTPGAPMFEAEFHLSAVNDSHFPRSRRQRLLWPLLRHHIVQQKKQWLKAADSVLPETRQMHAWLVRHGYIGDNDSWCPFPPGFERRYFHPRERDNCRRELGLDAGELVVLYVGSLNCVIHDPVPLLQGLGTAAVAGLRLIMIGEGSKRGELEAYARRRGVKALFPGQLDQELVSRYIGAANLCVAPYDLRHYPDGEMTSGSLKVAEYLACARPVLTVPCGRMRDLLADGEYGFMVENCTEAYARFFGNGALSDDLLAKERALDVTIAEQKLSAAGFVVDFQEAAGQVARHILARL